jgi:hypothetical protein
MDAGKPKDKKTSCQKLPFPAGPQKAKPSISIFLKKLDQGSKPKHSLF